VEIARPLEAPIEIVSDPFPNLGMGTDGVSELIRAGQGDLSLTNLDGTNTLPGVLNPPDTSALVPVDTAAPLATGFWSRLWGGIANLFGFETSVSGSEAGGRFYSGGDDAAVDPAAARRAIALDAPAADPNFSLNDPNPFTRVRQKMEIDMPGSESLESFLGRMAETAPEANRAEVSSILSLLTDPAAGSGTMAVNLRLEVAAEIRGSGQGYLNRYQIADAVRTVLARHGLDANTLETALGASGRDALSSVMQNLSLQLLPDDVPLYRTSGRGVREGATTATMRGNLDGMTYWGVGSDGIATAVEYLSDGRALVTTTVGELRRYGVLTTDDIAKAGNAVELYHDPRETGGWVSVPVRVVNRSLDAGPKSPNLL
jgi:hypothetical protein